ncbi:MAG: hypothetical protein EBR82_79165 [Caulobacteraceae bacterium]|nr:hypothetical protein [Caulobacteraceae bacterium]
MAVHGWIAKKGSGASALATLDRVNENVVQGHTHRQALVHVTKWIGGVPFLLTAVEAGTMAQRPGVREPTRLAGGVVGR